MADLDSLNRAMLEAENAYETAEAATNEAWHAYDAAHRAYEAACIASEQEWAGRASGSWPTGRLT